MMGFASKRRMERAHSNDIMRCGKVPKSSARKPRPAGWNAVVAEARARKRLAKIGFRFERRRLANRITPAIQSAMDAARGEAST